ncbi:unnamed protein product [Rotaria sp. Silwood1]|nr:unnamed protein product [Rotaria sp. Silwood1]CAF1154968.1 unnamed protein product [Rotaria sp. Silwood1]CAF3580785.1 unnamed protein product [Rotaria sp. Silwood1]CAF4927437.1 unnamed protein product [Rotaria sp. Silwood1]CAF5074251.1 unnamed protein product [Rotaria sp. Silwood1]
MNKLLVVMLIVLMILKKSETKNSSYKLICSNDKTCNLPNGYCLLNECICSKGWITTDLSTGCTYQQKLKLTAFLLSFFVGFFGVDWFYLSVSNPAYIIAGIIKLITLGGFGIWWIVDWIRLLADAFLDGNGFPLLDWNYN